MDESLLKKIIELEDQRPTGIRRTIYEQKDGTYILKVEYKGEIQWIPTGYATDFYDKEKDWTFQESFNIMTAIRYGYKVPCDYESSITYYKGLTCDPTSLEHIKNIGGDGASFAYWKEDIFKCPKCGKIWKIREEYDSHKGTWHNCYQLDGVPE